MKTYLNFIPFVFLPLLGGCPMGDRLDQRYKPAETATVELKNGEVCFDIPSPEDYQPVFISLAPRHTPLKARWYQQAPRLSVKEGEMCIPPDIYSFPARGEFVASFVRASKARAKNPEFNTRHFDVAFEIDAGRATPLTVSNTEF